ncbi:HD domain-containing phosphohydrolase [Thermoanaerobacterium sp. RBIITD]|uniref:HD-GYP domain-containing protein n=1 Tax=Thermoanaerobacterium sp. RBIITD TaxID=1550240 RepID=UPI000BB99B84|nr:HD domain-containing phosphohydrolase [Thermoanaerobacterium sp. RBIITD]SNX53520.1 HDIG domain-containing protein [Thermoanaerobacterium sp. RBIITD]
MSNSEEEFISERELISRFLKSLRRYRYETYLHSLRVAKISEGIAKVLGLDLKNQIYIYKGGLLHDIGKTKIPNCILTKPYKLTKEEYDIIKVHPQYGAEMLKIFLNMRYLIPPVLYHHEKPDGSGYPYGIKNIPLSAQIISVSDSFDAMTTERPYNKLKSVDQALDELKSMPDKYNIIIVNALEDYINYYVKHKC